MERFEVILNQIKIDRIVCMCVCMCVCIHVVISGMLAIINSIALGDGMVMW